jgi:hypothetical protein
LKWSIPSTQTPADNRLFPASQKKRQVARATGKCPRASPTRGLARSPPIACRGCKKPPASFWNPGAISRALGTSGTSGRFRQASALPNSSRSVFRNARRASLSHCRCFHHGVLVHAGNLAQAPGRLWLIRVNRAPELLAAALGGLGSFCPHIQPSRQNRFNSHDRSFRNFQNSC